MRWHTLKMLKQWHACDCVVWCGGLVGMQDWEGGVEVISCVGKGSLVMNHKQVINC